MLDRRIVPPSEPAPEHDRRAAAAAIQAERAHHTHPQGATDPLQAGSAAPAREQPEGRRPFPVAAAQVVAVGGNLCSRKIAVPGMDEDACHDDGSRGDGGAAYCRAALSGRRRSPRGGRAWRLTRKASRPARPDGSVPKSPALVHAADLRQRRESRRLLKSVALSQGICPGATVRRTFTM